MRIPSTCLAMAGLATLIGCGPGLLPQPLESKAVMRIHAPAKAQLARPFTVAVDVDSACGEFKRLTIAENGIAKTITVDAMFQPPPQGAGCIGAIVLKRYEGTVTPTSEGLYDIDFKTYNGRATVRVEVVAGAVPAWSPPAFDPGATSPNY